MYDSRKRETDREKERERERAVCSVVLKSFPSVQCKLFQQFSFVVTLALYIILPERQLLAREQLCFFMQLPHPF